ncbi:rhomboid family intramembrane serine protease [filamentous cyanobacterium LEGE 11480]|uniref:Rhomboid family intramembrane serine protease n=1 Tax=Romeriopsis navalis LEGE 11480 TaxID=2777977 RepID=A0A928VRX1_9CYAN|nr:rhomboid family intramembrane serine protease [Romeriopsis navalis]MBE9031450.1 rhomboid family intramembrane serine protease [Romeriopsis navalis LEGE 11480]
MGFELIPVLSGFSSLLILLQPRQTKGWRLVACSILGLLAIGWGIPQLTICLTIASCIWGIFLLLPVQGFAQVERLVSQEKFQAAAKLMSVTRWLHPLDGWWDYPQLLHGLALATAGQMSAAQRIFQQYQTGKSAIERLATILLHRINGNWGDFVAWVQQQPANSPVFQDPNIQLMYIRSLGELRQANELLDALQQFQRSLQQAGNPVFLNTARMYAFAFCGQPESLAWLLQQQMQGIPEPTRQFWMATAHWRAGHKRQGKQLFQHLQQTAAPGMQSAIADRLAQPARNIQRQLTLPSQHYLVQAQTQMMQAANPKITPRPQFKQIPVTTSLILINVAISVAFFGALFLIAGGITYADQLNTRSLELISQIMTQIVTLYNLGVLYPDQVMEGEWWRLLTAAFLHAGWFHLFSNMLGLYVLGGIVEPILGRLRYTIGYFATGVGSMTLVSILANLNLIKETAVVGASGAIMGLLGMMGAIFLVRWLRHKAAIAAQRLKMVVLIVVFQTIFDVLTPNVSMAGHLSGLGLGFAIGLVLMRTITREKAIA